MYPKFIIIEGSEVRIIRENVEKMLGKKLTKKEWTAFTKGKADEKNVDNNKITFRDSKLITVATKVPPDLKQRFYRRCEEEDLTPAEVIRSWIEAYMKE